MDQTGGSVKTPRSQIVGAGSYAVVDQGKGLIAGYTDDASRLCKTPLPVIVFGDHTKVFKFVDFPFCIGADGVKVLRPRGDADIKYLYHYLRQLHMPDGGYDRHFKYLKRAEIVLLSPSEQKRIAGILDQVDALHAKRGLMVAGLDALTQAIFLEMFGDPATNPRGWRLAKVGDIADQVTDGEHQTPRRSTSGIRLLSARNIRDGYIDYDNVDFIPVEEYERIKRRCDPRIGDVLISCSGSIGRVASVETSEAFSLVRSVALVRPRPSVVTATFLEHLLRTTALNRLMLQRANASSQANLFQSQIRELPVFLPAVDLQREFGRRRDAITKLREAGNRAAADLDRLYRSLQHGAFQGEL